MTVINLSIICLLIVLTAVFVAAEFSFVKVRASRIDQLVSEGNKPARSVRIILSNLDGYLSACQLGVTLMSLALGVIGEPTIEKIIKPAIEGTGLNFAAHFISILIAFSLVTYFEVVLGELIPKTFAIRNAEKAALILAKPLILFYKIAFPGIWILNGSSRFISKHLGLKPSGGHGEIHSEEELLLLMDESFEHGKISSSEFKYVSQIFEFDERLAREVMVPRVDLKVLHIDESIETMFLKIKNEQFTRFPICNDTKDEMLGMINTKDFFIKYIENNQFDINEILRPILFIPESTPIRTLMKTMQEKSNPIAILVDEYGGTAGLVTMEDIVEEIVGEIRDEFDGEEKPDMVKIDENSLIVEGKVLISEINDILNLTLETDEIDTINGLVMHLNSDLKVNENITFEGAVFTIIELDKRYYKRIKIDKTALKENP
jgi:CBS domain containing-hemolysin-like protein